MDILNALFGGVLIGIAAAFLLIADGRILGVSGILGGLLTKRPEGASWRLLFISGLLATGFAVAYFAPESFGYAHPGYLKVITAGLLVGIGTSLSGGCTSGHGVCGIGRLSSRSIIATLAFMTAGFLTVLISRWMGMI